MLAGHEVGRAEGLQDCIQFNFRERRSPPALPRRAEMLHVSTSPGRSFAFPFGRPAPLRTRFPLLAYGAETGCSSARPRRVVLRGRELLSAHRRRQHTPPHHPPLFHIATAYAYDMHVSARAARRFRCFRPPPILFSPTPPLHSQIRSRGPRSWTWV
jgi:hypothetical protein